MTRAFWACAKCRAHGVLPRIEDVHNTDRWKKEVGHAECIDFQLIGEESPDVAVKAIIAVLARAIGLDPQVADLHFWYCDICAVYSVSGTNERSNVCCAEATFLNLRYPDQRQTLDTLLNVISDFEFLDLLR